MNWRHPPVEGVFERGSKEWKYMHRRFWIAYFPIWLARATPLPWIDIVCYRLFGVNIGKNVVAYEGYIDPVSGLISIDDYSMTSLNICIFSHLIYSDKVLIKKVKIGKACVVGPQSMVAPGTTMEDGAVLGANSYTWINQKLEGDLIHVGTPVSVKFPIQTVEASLEKVEKIKKEDLNYKEGGAA
jgi:acetyltransferase-like isoleucine patch superfamily enzyme